MNNANLGVGALTVAHIRILDELAERLSADFDFDVINWPDPDMPDYLRHPRARMQPFSRRFLLARRDGLRQVAADCAMVLDIGGGDSFTDIYGAKRFLYQAVSKAVVLRSGTPLVLAPQTIGPFQSAWSRMIAREIMRRCRLVVTRDEISTRFVRDLHPGIPLLEATDVAFHLPYPALPPIGDGRVRVGLNISGLLNAGGYKKRNDFRLLVDYPSLVKRIISDFLSKDGVEVHLFSHVVVPKNVDTVEDDQRIAERLAKEFPKVRVSPAGATPGETKAQIARMDFFCGSRMHACIAAFSAGVPTLPLAYSRKFIGVFRTLGYDLVADCTADTEDEIMSKIHQGFEQRETLRKDMDSMRAEADRRLSTYSDKLYELLKDDVG
ncbi:polysaccharide pyruvyl transferase family protein [Roseivivax lentus]|nr:polysaccharide pyruvyl transferase family protein [Roseivivax lentus]